MPRDVPGSASEEPVWVCQAALIAAGALVAVVRDARRVLLLLLLQDLLLPCMLPDQARHPLRLGLDRVEAGLLRQDPVKLLVGPGPNSS